MGYSQRRRIEEQVAREIGLLLLLLALALAQTALAPRVLGAPPHLLLLLCICQSLIAGPANAARWALYAGLSLDLCAATPLGSHALALLAAVLLAAPPLARLSRGNWLLPLLAVLLGASAYYALWGGLMALLVAPIDLRDYLLVVVLPGMITVLVPALPVFLTLRALEGRREVPIDVY